MDNIKTKITSQQLYFIIDLINKKKAQMIHNACTRLNIYQLYATIELERKFTRKLMSENKSDDYSIKIDLIEALTLHDLLSGCASDITISKLYMTLQKYLPKIN